MFGATKNNSQLPANDPKDEAHKHLVYTTLTYNSFTLYTYENSSLLEQLLLPNTSINCVDIINSQLSFINNPSLFSIGIIPICSISNLSNSTKRAVNNNSLTLYYVKYNYTSDDLITILTICSSRLKKEIPLAILDKILASYKGYRQKAIKQNATPASNQVANPVVATNSNNGFNVFGDFEFKSKFAKIIINEEKKINSMPTHLVLRDLVGTKGAKYSLSDDNIEQSDLSNLNMSFLTSELEDLQQIMNENVDKILDRGDRIGLLVNKTDRLNLNSAGFKRRTLQLKRKLWFNNVRFKVIVSVIVILTVYLLGGSACGLPFYGKCFHA